MHAIKEALASTSAHGLPRIVSEKSLTVRLAWLIVLMIMGGLFLNGFIGFVVKLESQQVTSTLEGNSLDFRFPDLYACYENPISGSYAASIDAASAAAINAQLNDLQEAMQKGLANSNFSGNRFLEMKFSRAYPQSISYQLLVDALAHRNEQNVITSDVTYNTDYGMPEYAPIEAETFYHPMYLRCLKWTLNSTWQKKILQTGSTSGIVVTLVTDSAFDGLESSGHSIQQIVYARQTQIPVTDWSLDVSDFNGPDRQAGVKFFLTPPGEYPSDFVTSFTLEPGKFHTVEIDMMQQIYEDGQFSCLSNHPAVQFVNPYDETPYNHSYSYSYCYYYEHHRQMQKVVNMSSHIGPLPWPLRSKKFVMNLTGEPNFFAFFSEPSVQTQTAQFDRLTKAECKPKRPCSTLDYSVSVSRGDWPTRSSLAPFVNSSIRQAWMLANSRNQSVPVLDLLVTANESTVSSYIRTNMLKVHFKPRRVLCDRMKFSIDYGLQNFISDVGGIMGIYLGMSLLTLCELLELLFDIASFGRSKAVVFGFKERTSTQKIGDEMMAKQPPRDSPSRLSVRSVLNEN